MDKPPVVAVTGGYGEGKSSILNLVEEVLARETQVIVVRFNSWVPGNEQSYAASFFSTISGQIQKRFFFPELRKPLMELARTVAGSIPKIPLKEFLAQASQTTEIQEMKSVFARLPVRVVVLVDEVDRMQPDELGTLLRVIRGIDQIENLTYVCALNLKAVTKIVEKWSVNPSEYLEKFFTAQLALPKVDSVLLENLFSESIDRIVTSLQIFETSGGRKQFDEDLSSVWSKTLKWQLTNLRKMGQFLRLFESTLGAVRREVNAHDLLVLQALQILVPEAYEFIYSRANLFYVTNWRIEKWSEAPHVDDSRAQVVRNEAFKEFFDSLDDTQRPLAEALMGEIFPVVEQYKAAGRFGLSMRSEGQASLERRIYHPDFFPRYFIHRAPLNLFSETELANFAKALRSATTASKQRAIEDMLSRVQQNPSRRWDFWDRLGKAVKGLDDESRIALARAAAKASKTFAQGFLGIGEYSAGRRLVFIAATDLDDKSRVQPLLDSVIKDATSDYFASDIVRFGSRTDDPSLAELVGFVDAQKLAEAFGARMSKLYYPGSSLGPDYKSGDAVHAFVRWSGTSDEAKQKVYAYFRSRFKFSPTDEELFILWSVPPDASFEGSIKAFFELLFPFPEFRDLTAPHRPNWSEAALRSFARLESDPGPSPSQESAQ